MSWSIKAEIPADQNSYSKIRQALYNAFDENLIANETAGTQKEFAIDMALAAIGGVARAQDGLVIYLSGHYNQDLEPKEGWANCMISVSVNQVVSKEPVSV